MKVMNEYFKGVNVNIGILSLLSRWTLNSTKSEREVMKVVYKELTCDGAKSNARK